MKSRDSTMETLDRLLSMLTMSNHTLVLGGNGKTGRRIVERLQAQGVEVRVGSRSHPVRLVRRVDVGRRARGHRRRLRVLLPRPHDRGRAGDRRRVRAPRRRPRRQAAGAALRPRRAEAQRAEQELIAAGTEWTVVRCSWFAQNFSEAFMLEGVLAGELALPAGDVPEPFVDVEDIADVAVAALTAGRPRRARLRAHRPARADVRGGRRGDLGRDRPRRPLRPRAGGRVPRGDARGAACRRTRPGSSRSCSREVLDGRNAQPQDGVRQALGRGPRDFGEYARVTAASGVWA